MKTNQLYIFQTSIRSLKVADTLIKLLPHYFKITDISFDITEMTSLLRVRALNISPKQIQLTLKEFGYNSKIIAQSD